MEIRDKASPLSLSRGEVLVIYIDVDLKMAEKQRHTYHPKIQIFQLIIKSQYSRTHSEESVNFQMLVIGRHRFD